MKFRLVPADGYSGDVSGAIELAMRVLRKPDGEHNFKNWFAKWMYDVLAYDAGTLARLRNRAGKCVGLQPVDGTMIAPLLDYWGNSPKPPAEAYVQYANGLPWNWLTRDDMIYEPFRAVNDCDLRPGSDRVHNTKCKHRYEIPAALFAAISPRGNIPEAFASAPESWTPGQYRELAELLGLVHVRGPGRQAPDQMDAGRQLDRVEQ